MSHLCRQSTELDDHVSSNHDNSNNNNKRKGDRQKRKDTNSSKRKVRVCLLSHDLYYCYSQWDSQMKVFLGTCVLINEVS